MNITLQPGETLFVEVAAVTGSIVIDYDEHHDIAVGISMEPGFVCPADESEVFHDPSHPKPRQVYKIVARQEGM